MIQRNLCLEQWINFDAMVERHPTSGKLVESIPPNLVGVMLTKVNI